MSSLADKLIVEPGSRLKLEKVDADASFGVEKAAAAEKLAKNLERLSELQYLLYAEAKRSVLVVVHGIGAAGKDGTIRHVMTGLNPQGVRVTSFKVPEGDERRHDYLWRIHRACPEWGSIGIFNRSHYEDVLVVRVHELVPKSVWTRRYRQINEFERSLAESGVTILKFLLYISKEEQAKRFRERLDDPKKNWKFSEADARERRYWDDYLGAYDDMLEKCSTEYAPWYVIPSNRKCGLTHSDRRREAACIGIHTPWRSSDRASTAPAPSGWGVLSRTGAIRSP
ncbi:MAG: polyphosphate kinase 2 family protein [Acidobacteria bacterium]|nr:polyphosphate kinase 2 family protein [Acidobacteriota bacterium]